MSKAKKIRKETKMLLKSRTISPKYGEDGSILASGWLSLTKPQTADAASIVTQQCLALCCESGVAKRSSMSAAVLSCADTLNSGFVDRERAQATDRVGVAAHELSGEIVVPLQ